MALIERGDAPQVFVPQVDTLFLRNFSLYDNAPEIEVVFRDGVFCLAGANGLGKSTFLAALNFGLTGVVADPSRSFRSPGEYYRASLAYSGNYFRGRITERDAQLAEVTIRMTVNERSYEITRGMFEPSALRHLEIRRGDVVEYEQTDSVDDGERQTIYAREVTKDCGLSSFAQLVFLQHFVLTFDERRHLLFWDSDVALSALFMAFGADLAEAERAENLRRTSEKADSLARNLQWQATDIRKKLEDLEKTAALDAGDSSDPDLDLAAEHERLQNEHDDLVALMAARQASLRDADLNVANTRASLNAVNDAYDHAIESLTVGTHRPESHPVVSAAMLRSHCSVCGTEGAGVVEAINRSLGVDECPLCRSTLLVAEDDESALADLDGLDQRRADLSERIDEEQAIARRVADELAQLRGLVETASGALDEFETANELSAKQNGSVDGIQVVADRYRDQIAELVVRKDEQRKKRDAARKELRPLEAALTLAYAEAEEEFVPTFAGLAREFLGLDVNVTFEATSRPPLVLSVQSKQRRTEDALSESQRFFIDIALRMAIARHLTNGGDPACLYVDTPEGSLDIAYERRAGSMFANFVGGGDRVVMTANINSSQLLLRLAEACGPAKMALLRMTEWTSLSDVQAEEETLFDLAYAAIETALEHGGK